MNSGIVAGFFRECSNPHCNFRYPDLMTDSEVAYCPKCGALAPVSCIVKSDMDNHLVSENALGMIVLLDNIRSVYNVGSIFRTCEGLGIEEIILAGITSTPEHPRMNKTGLGAIPNLKWQYVKNGFDKAGKLKSLGYQLISLESTKTAFPIEAVKKKVIKGPVCLVVGNENL